MITIEEALRIALEAHEGQKDLDGNPVILHPMAVAMAGSALRLLTHTKDVPYEDYVQRIAKSGNEVAIHVKYNDLCHNLKRGRAGGHTKQVQKHEKALAIIEPLIK